MAAEVFIIDTDNFDPQGYSGQDNILISSQEVNTTFTTSSYIELNIYNANNELVLNDGIFSNITFITMVNLLWMVRLHKLKLILKKF